MQIFGLYEDLHGLLFNRWPLLILKVLSATHTLYLKSLNWIMDKANDMGSEISTGNYDADVLCNTAVLLPVPSYQAATWFYPNTLTIWEEEEYVKNTLTPEKRARIREHIRLIMTEQNKNKGCTWKMRRIVLKKT
jgi:hypothetical protein